MTWDDWLVEHMKTCKTCWDAFEGTGEGGMCEVAFAKAKDYARESRDKAKAGG